MLIYWRVHDVSKHSKNPSFNPSRHISISHNGHGKVSAPPPAAQDVPQAAGRGPARQRHRGPSRDKVHHGHRALELSPRQLLRQQRRGGLAEAPRHRGAKAEGREVGLEREGKEMMGYDSKSESLYK